MGKHLCLDIKYPNLILLLTLQLPNRLILFAKSKIIKKIIMPTSNILVGIVCSKSKVVRLNGMHFYYRLKKTMLPFTTSKWQKNEQVYIESTKWITKAHLGSSSHECLGFIECLQGMHGLHRTPNWLLARFHFDVREEKRAK